MSSLKNTRIRQNILWLLLVYFSTSCELAYSQNEKGVKEKKEQMPIQVVCPPIEVDERRRTNAPFESTKPVCLVVQGKIKMVKQEDGGDSVMEVKVDKTLYGARKLDTVRFETPWRLGKGQNVIVALTREIHGETDFTYRYLHSTAELKSQLALAEPDSTTAFFLRSQFLLVKKKSWTASSFDQSKSSVACTGAN